MATYKQTKTRTTRLTPNKQEWLHQKRRIQRAVRELEKQGYRFTPEVKDFISTQLEMPSRVTQKQLKKIQNISRSTLRGHATALSPKTGKVVSGTQAFKESLSERSRKSAITRNANRRTSPTKRKGKIEQQTTRGVTDKDIATRNKRKETISQKPKGTIERLAKQDVSNIPSVNDFIFSKLQERIEEYDTPGAHYLRNLLNREIGRFGFDAVMQTVNDMPESILSEIDYVIFYEEYTDTNGASRSLRKFADAIQGAILSDKDLQDFSLMVEENYNNVSGHF